MLDEIALRKKEEERMRAEGRLPPGQSLTLKFPVLHYGRVPPFDPGSWEFRIWGEVKEERVWSWQEFQALPRTKIKMDIHCVTRWSKFDTEWEGISLRDLADREWIDLNPGAHYVIQHCEFNFSTNLPLEVVMGENFLLATHFNGEPLTPDHGYPLRGVVGHIPGRDDLPIPYFWKGGKWLRGLQFASQDQPGFWEQAGYHNEGDVWKEQRTA